VTDAGPELQSDSSGRHLADPAGPSRPHRQPGWALVAVIVVLALLVGGLFGWLIHRGGAASAASRAGDGAGACDAVGVAHSTLPSVVTILTRTRTGGSGNGSGEIVREGGYILTNEHVIAPGAGGGSVAVRYSDGTTTPATVVGEDALTDLAVVKAEDGAQGRPLIGIGSSSGLQVGQPVVALGAPLGLSSTVTAGIVSALDRYVPVPAGEGQTAHLIDAIQTDASINPGNSGGALVDCAGDLVGINTAISTVPNAAGHGGGGSVGIGFAIPVDLAMPLANQLISTGSANHPTLGLQAQTIPRTAGAPQGLFVTAVTPGGPAAQAGIQPGDVITEVDGQAASSVAVLEVATLRKSAGDTVSITYERDGASTTVTVTLAAT
jgi:putative serine protease PepD